MNLLCCLCLFLLLGRANGRRSYHRNNNNNHRRLPQGSSLMPRGAATMMTPSASMDLVKRIRGGGGASSSTMGLLIKPELAAKIFVVVFGLNCISGVLAPEAHLAAYQIEADYMNKFMIQEVTGVGCNIALLFYLQVFKDMPFEKAVGWHAVPYSAMTLNKLFTDQHATIGMPKYNGLVVLGLNMAVSIASYLKATSGDLSSAAATSIDYLFKFYALFSLLNGVAMLLAPVEAAKAWKADIVTGQNKWVVVVLGVYLVTHFAAAGLQAFHLLGGGGDEVVILAAAGWTITTLAASLLAMTFSKFFAPAKISRVPITVWVAFLALLAASLLLQ